MALEHPEALFRAQSRELELVCDAAGTVTWLDDRAQRLLRAEPGARLFELAAPDCFDAVERFVRIAVRQPLDGWEISLVVEGALAAAALRSFPHAGGAAIVASLLPDPYAESFRRAAAVIAELAALHYEADRRRRETQRLRDEISSLRRALEDSDRGLVAMHAELDEKQASLRRAADLERHVVANVSHELRTPLGSIIGLSRLLLEHSDGELTPEQDRQVGFILQSAEALAELVDDILDLSRLESGRVELRLGRFTTEQLFAALRGMLRPLARDGVELVFEDRAAGVELETDEGKTAQILRNLIGNALKFTERGEVRVSAELAGDCVRLRVADTGIGIAPEDQARIFEEFVQIDSAIQRRVKGTGLGLSLSVRLAERIGGRIAVESELGVGSAFTLTIPRVHPAARKLALRADRERTPDATRTPVVAARSGPIAKVLVIDDDEVARYLVRSFLRDTPYAVVEADSGAAGIEAARRERPDVIFLDFVLRDETAFDVLDALERAPEMRSIPVVVHTSKDLGPDEQGRLAARVVAVHSKQSLSREVAIARVDEARICAGRRPGSRGQGS